MSTDIALRLEQKLGALREQFLHGLPRRLDQMDEAIRTRAVHELERGFHSLAGTAATYGFSGVAALAAAGEQTCAASGGEIDDSMVGSLSSLLQTLHALSGSPEPPSRNAIEGRILCVDDDPDQLAYVESILRHGGYEVQSVSSAAEFAPALAELRPDLVVMDILLPDATGVDLVRCVRQDDAHATLPIVFLTGQCRAAARMEALEVGGDDYLTKPVSPDLLLSVVASRLKRSRSMRNLIDRDGLTGVLTRSALMRRAQAVADGARRHGAPAAFVMLDLDHFKSINDRFGHATGDRVLTSFALMLVRRLRSGDEVGRLGGEEFGIVIGDADAGDVQRLVSRLLDEFAAVDHSSADGTPLYATFSAGVAMFEQGDDLETWVRRADDALYVAKRGGRARVEAA